MCVSLDAKQGEMGTGPAQCEICKGFLNPVPHAPFLSVHRTFISSPNPPQLMANSRTQAPTVILIAQFPLLRIVPFHLKPTWTDSPSF